MKKNKIVLLDIDHTLFDTEKFKASKLTNYSLYEEVLDILKKLEDEADLGIFSEGILEFQKTKLKNTKLEQFFKEKHIHIFGKKESELLKTLNSYKKYKVFLVDDRLSILHLAKKNFPSIFTIWVKRGPHAQKQKEIEGFTPDETVFNLQELERLIV